MYTRRHVLGTRATTPIAAARGPAGLAGALLPADVDTARVRSRLEPLSLHGRPAGATLAARRARREPCAATPSSTSSRARRGAGQSIQIGILRGSSFQASGGIGHSPRELSSWSDCAIGASMLLDAVLSMDAVT